MVKEYISQDGYRIRVSEKAYNLLYRKNGFMPVEAAVPTGEATTTGNTTPVKDIVRPDGETAKANKGKRKAAASKSGENTATENTSRQEELPEDTTDTDTASQDVAEQQEGE